MLNVRPDVVFLDYEMPGMSGLDVCKAMRAHLVLKNIPIVFFTGNTNLDSMNLALKEGATDYVKLLTQRFPEAAQSAQSGDASGFVAGLKQRGYFTGDAHAYTRSVVSLSAQALSHGYGSVGSHLGELGAPAELNLHATPLATARYEDYVAGPQVSSPLIDALRIGDEISRAALRIVARSPASEDS